MININNLITEGFGDFHIRVTINDLLTFANTLLQGMQNTPTETSEQDNKLMTRQEVMAYLNIKETTLHNWGKLGLLKPTKINRKCYYNKNDILALQRGDTKNNVKKETR